MENWKQRGLQTTPPGLLVSVSIFCTFQFTEDIHLLIKYRRALAGGEGFFLSWSPILITKTCTALAVVNVSTPLRG